MGGVSMTDKEEREEKGLIAFRPFRELTRLQEEIDRMWDTMFGVASWRPVRPAAGVWAPRVDVVRKDGKVVVKADLPGLTEKDVEVEVDEDAVVLKGEKSEEVEEKEADYYLCERTYGRFQRRVPLPQGCNIDEARATFKNGVLEVEIPVKESAKQRKIEVK
jgi:HSP20 family protein